MAPAVAQALKLTGLYRITSPKRMAGEGETVRVFVDTVSELAKTCPGSAWAYGIVTASTAMAASLPRAKAEQLFKRGDELTCFVGSKTGTATPCDGGFLISGQWPYASGCLQVDWAWCGVVIHDVNGSPVDMGNAFIDLSAEGAEIVRDWKVAGLSASGSHRVVAQAHFVPSELLIRDSELANRANFVTKDVAEPRDVWPAEPQFALTVVPAMLGAAVGMLEAVRHKINDRPIIGWQYDRQADSHLLLAMLGEAAIKIDSAFLHIYRVCDIMDLVSQDRTVTTFEKVQCQTDCGYAMRLLREAADTLLNVAGPNAFALTSDIQSYWRDLSIGSRHNALNSGLSTELLGRALTKGKSNIRNIPEF
ncbi:hypothetical protein WG907_17170 [Sphingobium sp. AN558]|uniref:hypothetical protein n=1 Tax=Sphingobium sp. AN558 TaxID=3133442 RepID=UPI0030BF4F03